MPVQVMCQGQDKRGCVAPHPSVHAGIVQLSERRSEDGLPNGEYMLTDADILFNLYLEGWSRPPGRWADLVCRLCLIAARE